MNLKKRFEFSFLDTRIWLIIILSKFEPLVAEPNLIEV